MSDELSDRELVQINQAIFSLRNIYESRLRGEGTAAMAGLGIGELGVLMVVGQCGAITGVELAEKMDLTKGTVSIHVGKLASRGFLLQTRSGRDRRKWTLSLSGAGETLYGDLIKGTANYTEALLAPLDAADRRTLHRLLTTLARENGYDWQ